MPKLNLTTVRIFGEKYALDTILVIFFGPLMASGIIEALRFSRALVVSIPIIVMFLYRYWQETFSYRERPDSYLEMPGISIE